MHAIRSIPIWRLAAICLALAVATFVLYWPSTHNDFTNIDDGGYIVENSHVNSGLSAANVSWAFGHPYAGYWIPLTWISHMVDCQLFGLNPGGHHLMNSLYHTANTLLLFLLLNNLTGAIWRSAFAAALFAWHPLRVESVAWAAERKDVLSGFFFMLTLLAWTKHLTGDKCRLTRGDDVLPRVTFHPSPFYFLAVFLFACGLMSKPMIVTLPCIMLLLDFWPLGRFKLGAEFSVRDSWKLILEKIPFFALSLAAGVTTLALERNQLWASLPLGFRIENIPVSYVSYISKTFWPTDLAIIYPFPDHWPLSFVLFSSSLLAGWTVLFAFRAKQNPYLLMGWLWFLGMLVPVIGQLPGGIHSVIADYFTYIPGIGLVILAVWSIGDFFASTWSKQIFAALLGIATAAGCFTITSNQITYWRNSITLFSHALDVTTSNYVACAGLAQAFDDAGDEERALAFSREAVRLDAGFPPGQFYLGTALWKSGDASNALIHLQTAVQMAPGNPIYQYNLGNFLLEQGKPDESVACFKAALDDNPDFAEAHNVLGKALLKLGKKKEAVDHLSQAVALKPTNPLFRYDLGTILLDNGNLNEAVAQLSMAVKLKPDLAPPQQNLAIAFARSGNLPEAIAHFAKAAELQPDNVSLRFNFGLALLNNHQPAAAAAQFLAELRLAPGQAAAHFRLAQALQQQNQLADAVAHYRQALRLTPDFPEAEKALDEILATHPELRK